METGGAENKCAFETETDLASKCKERVSGLIKEFLKLKRRCSALKEFKLQHFNSIGWVEHRHRVCLEEEPLDKLIFTFWRGSLAFHYRATLKGVECEILKTWFLQRP